MSSFVIILPFLVKELCYSEFRIIKGIRSDVSNVVNADEFEYKDPVDGSISKHQGVRYLFEDVWFMIGKVHVLFFHLSRI